MTDQEVPSSKSVSVSIGMVGAVSLEGLDGLAKWSVGVTMNATGVFIVFERGQLVRRKSFSLIDMINEASFDCQIPPGEALPPKPPESLPRRMTDDKPSGSRPINEGVHPPKPPVDPRLDHHHLTLKEESKPSVGRPISAEE